eukprot:gene46786-57294_t
MGNKQPKEANAAVSAAAPRPPPASKAAPTGTKGSKDDLQAEQDMPPPPPADAAQFNSKLAMDDLNFNNKLTINDFDLLKVLGKGSFGKVMLVKKKDDSSGTLYAMKTLRIAALVKRNQVAHTATERFILQAIHCPFLVHLAFAFRTPDK